MRPGVSVGRMDTVPLSEHLDARLRALGSPERAEAEQRYLKSEALHYGVSVPALRRLARQVAAGLDRERLLDLVQASWGRGVHEHRMMAALLLAERVDLLEPRDIGLVERLLRDSRTWALVDLLAPHVAGPLIEQHPDLVPSLDAWADDDDVWLRRASLLAELVPLREGRGDFDRFARHADPMLEEKEFFVRKAIGWVLRDTSRKRPDLVRDWVAPRAHRMSGVTIREAVKRLPEEDRQELMAAYRDKRPGKPRPRPRPRPHDVGRET